MARWSRAIPRRCARSPISGPSRARSPREIRTGSWSPPKPPISSNLTKRLLPLAAIVATIALLLWRCGVDDHTVSLKPVSFFETHYVPHRFEGVRPGLVTGYYEPEVNGSLERSDRFHVPVYRRPDDLVTVKPDLLRALYNDSRSVMRRSGEQLVPYYTRAEIDSGALEGSGLELLYLDDPIELFFMQIQGSR